MGLDTLRNTIIILFPDNWLEEKIKSADESMLKRTLNLLIKIKKMNDKELHESTEKCLKKYYKEKGVDYIILPYLLTDKNVKEWQNQFIDI